MVEWDKDKCLRCGGCVGICPQDALELFEQGIAINKELCKECGICAKFCPVGALKVKK
jgi:heterodisulfide reductase subunit A-like polyferredoxin